MISIKDTINITSKIKIYGIIGALITLIVPFFLMLFNGNNHLETDQSFCPFKMLTGLPCAGCGITKSMVYLYEGDLLKSLYYHLLGPFLVLFCIIIILALSHELFTNKEYLSKFIFNKKLGYGLALFLIGYQFIRIIYFIKYNSVDGILHQSIWR